MQARSDVADALLMGSADAAAKVVLRDIDSKQKEKKKHKPLSNGALN